MVSVHPARRRTSPPGVVTVGLGDGAGECHDAANLLKISFYFTLVSFSLGKLCSFLEYGCVYLDSAGYASSEAGAHSVLP